MPGAELDKEFIDELFYRAIEDNTGTNQLTSRVLSSRVAELSLLEQGMAFQVSKGVIITSQNLASIANGPECLGQNLYTKKDMPGPYYLIPAKIPQGMLSETVVDNIMIQFQANLIRYVRLRNGLEKTFHYKEANLN